MSGTADPSPAPSGPILVTGGSGCIGARHPGARAEAAGGADAGARLERSG
jgi:hypothetical protein